MTAPDGEPREELVTSAELAAIFGRNTDTVRRWVKTGRIRAIRNPGGGQLRFRLSDVLQDLAPRASGKPPGEG